MTWLQCYRVRHYFINSLWILPVAGMVAALAAVPPLVQWESERGTPAVENIDGARLLLATMASSMFTFIIFVSSALLISVQLASAQLTPRIIAIVFRDPKTKFALTLFVFTFTFAMAVLVRVNTSVPMFAARLAGYGSLASLGIFLYLIDHVGKALRPSGALRAVARLGRQVIERVYPKPFDAAEATASKAVALEGEPSLVVMSHNDGAVLAVDIQGLVALARRADCVIELVPRVGDYVAVGDPLFRVFGGREKLSMNVLRHSLVVGQERTMEQDPALAFRMMVDIASKGLSPAINDPTMAVLAIDQIHHLLRNVGNRNLDDERVRDSGGLVRLVYRTPSWDDFVQLAVTEIRHFGAQSVQVARRLRAMLENLIQTLPAARAPLLRQELSLLHRSAERFFVEPEDRELAEVSDLQGMGSKCKPNSSPLPT